MGTIKLTAKRQATFPAEVCEGLGIEPGDELELIPSIDDNGERVWQLRKVSQTPDRAWLGSLNQYAKNTGDHSIEAIRKSIVEGRTQTEKDS